MEMPQTVRRSAWSTAVVGCLSLSDCAPPVIETGRSDPGTATAAFERSAALATKVAQSGKIDSRLQAGRRDLGPLPPIKVNGDHADFVCSLNRYSLTRYPEEFVAVDSNADWLIPGALVQGKSMSDGVPAPIPVSRAPLTLSLLLATGSAESQSERVDNPTLSAIVNAQNRILARYDGPTPARFFYQTTALSSVEQFAVEIGANVHGLGWEVGAALAFQERDEKQRLLVRFTQAFYTMAIDPPSGPSGVFAPTVTADDLSPYVGPGNPATYVSSVTYGRVFYLLFESTSSASDLQASVRAAVDLGIAGAGNLDSRARKVVNESTIRAYAIGGDAQRAVQAATGISLGSLNGSAQKVDALGKIAAYLRDGARFGKESPGAALSYTLRYLGDSSQVRLALATEYDIKNCKAITNCVDDHGNKGTLDSCDVCNGHDECLTKPCAPQVLTHREPNCAYVSAYLPRFGATSPAPHGTVIDFQDGVGHGYAYPTCRRISWWGMKFRCQNGAWLAATPPLFSNDSYCHGDANNDLANNVATGADGTACALGSDF